jgi:hypothetical protein
VPDTTLLTSILCPLAETIITRECLSSLRAVRTDIPADHYEGCRPAAKDVRLAHYVNNSIKELDIKRYAFTTGNTTVHYLLSKFVTGKKKKKTYLLTCIVPQV